MDEKEHIKGRGAQHNTHNRFSKLTYERVHEEALDLPPENRSHRTEFITVHPKSIVNDVKSPDVGMDYSLNPYQGCEHGCVYCYARNSHEYWGYSAGMDFEEKILVKEKAVELLRKKLDSPSWKPRAIALSGNTDCYQPAERKLEITRRLLQTFLEYRHPVGIITKNALIQRDLDVLKPLAEMRLIKVVMSITTLDEDLRRMMEPRTASIAKRLDTVEVLSKAGIPVQVMMAPIIPGLNSHEILPLTEAAAARGALKAGYTMVRLNGAVAAIFEEWLRRTMPDRAAKILRYIAESHGGSLGDSRFKTRMKGEGSFADAVRQSFRLANSRYMSGRSIPDYDFTKFRSPPKNGQLSIF